MGYCHPARAELPFLAASPCARIKHLSDVLSLGTATAAFASDGHRSFAFAAKRT